MYRTNQPHWLAVKLRALRKTAGLSLQGFEDKHGIAAVRIGSYERGDRTMSVPQAEQLLGCYGWRLTAEPVTTGDTPPVLPRDDLARLLRSLADQVDREPPAV
jgi:transcriptional regulator with XRE-family HTH domain